MKVSLTPAQQAYRPGNVVTAVLEVNTQPCLPSVRGRAQTVRVGLGDLQLSKLPLNPLWDSSQALGLAGQSQIELEGPEAVFIEDHTALM